MRSGQRQQRKRKKKNNNSNRELLCLLNTIIEKYHIYYLPKKEYVTICVFPRLQFGICLCFSIYGALLAALRVNEDEWGHCPLLCLYWFLYHHVNPWAVIDTLVCVRTQMSGHTHTMDCMDLISGTCVSWPIKFWWNEHFGHQMKRWSHRSLLGFDKQGWLFFVFFLPGKCEHSREEISKQPLQA